MPVTSPARRPGGGDCRPRKPEVYCAPEACSVERFDGELSSEFLRSEPDTPQFPSHLMSSHLGFFQQCPATCFLFYSFDGPVELLHGLGQLVNTESITIQSIDCGRKLWVFDLKTTKRHAHGTHLIPVHVPRVENAPILAMLASQSKPTTEMTGRHCLVMKNTERHAHVTHLVPVLPVIVVHHTAHEHCLDLRSTERT